MNDPIVKEKVLQAVELLREYDLDAWLTFVRETSNMKDPVLPLIFGENDLTWESALLIARDGQCTAILGSLEVDTARSLGVYKNVHPYDASISPVLQEVIQAVDPQKIAVNISKDNVRADGLTYGMHELLVGYLEGIGYQDRLCSAEKLIAALTGRKTATEINRISSAVRIAEEIFDRTFGMVRTGMSEVEIAAFMHDQLASRNLHPAWNYDDCPIVNVGPESPKGHALPSAERKLRAGQILHIDFGAKSENYCSDLQRVAYVLQSDEKAAPVEVSKAFDLIKDAIQIAVEKTKPGAIGLEIDTLVRSYMADHGYPEYNHALGHQVGRLAHDGGSLMGPAWERYGEMVYVPLEEGQVFTIEPSLVLPEYGIIGIEEDILITNVGAEFISNPQTELILI
jgi:Xaa-Pro aminopeptidase